MNSRTPTLRLERSLEPDQARLLAPLLGLARNLGVGVCGTRGVGKSQLLRLIAWLDLTYYQTPSFLLDPVGTTIDSILAHICRFSPEEQTKLWKRILYLNLSPHNARCSPPLLLPNRNRGGVSLLNRTEAS